MTCCGLFGAGALGYDYVVDPGDFITEVVSYDKGDVQTLPRDRILNIPIDQPAAALGRPTVDTTGENWFIPVSQAVAVVPIYGPFRVYEIVAIGEGGQLVLAFDHAVTDDPRNPCGIDFIVYGNALLTLAGGAPWLNGDPNQSMIGTATSAEPGIVSVAQTHDPAHPELTVWHTFDNGPSADTFAPTLGRVYDPVNAPAGSPHNGWWGPPTHPLIPFNPSLEPADMQGLSLADCAGKYGYSAGGTGFDLAEIGLSWFRYVRISNPAGSGITPEIDAVADVDPDAPAPDFDCDTDVDADDVAFFGACVTGPAAGPVAAGCERADLDQDGDVDQADFGVVQRCFGGPDLAADPDCKGW